MNIIWGYGANPHITAQQLRDTYVGIFGSDTYILDVGSKMAATVISATEVQIADGVLIAQGCTASINYGQTESLTIQNGTQGMLRKDLIVAQYMKSTGYGVESMSLAVKRGTPAASNPATPAYTTGSIADGDTLAEFPLYVVNLDGINITSVERLADVVSIKGNMDSLAQRITDVEAHMPEHIEYTWEYSTIGINANGAYSDTKRIGITGYTPNAIKGFRILNNDTNGKNAGWCIFPKLWVYNNALDFTIWNQHSSQQAIVKVQIKIDYVSNNSV
jgi:hypothetical protein